MVGSVVGIQQRYDALPPALNLSITHKFSTDADAELNINEAS
jgi:hypothetical protein